jgi:hypothetical protein
MHLSRFIIFFILFFISIISVRAQSATIRGFVYEKETGEPALFTNVYLRGTIIGSSTDINGYFSISRVPPGSYELIVSFIGFDSLVTPVTVKADEIQTLKLYVERKSVDIGTVEVTAERQEARTAVQVSVTKVTPREIKQLPSIGGQPDLAQYLQVLPGVVFTGDQGGQLYIRGGTPIQNKVLLDGMIVYNPFHSIGLFSVFDTDIIRNADVYTGGFSAEYGDRISSVMDITTREGNKNRYGGKVGASPFTKRLLLEGPIKRATNTGDGNSSFIFSSKASFLEQTSKVLYEYVDTAGLPYNFLDLYGKISLNAANGSKLNFFGFRFQDDVNYPGLAELGWESMGFGTSFVLVPGGSTVLIDGNFAFSSYEIELIEVDLQPRSSEINGFNFGMGFTYFLGRDQIKYGIELLGFKTNFVYYNSLGALYSQEENTTEIGAFVKYKKLIGSKFVLDPSVRFQYYASLSEFTLEPRLGVKYNVTDRLRLKFAGGYYSQNFISASSDRDVVNLFYGFLSGPQNLPARFEGEVVDSKLQKARHTIAGLEIDLPYNLSLNVEGYIKEFSQLTNINRDKLFADNAENFNKPDAVKKDFIIEKGTAKGIDFLLKYDYKRLYLWAVYSLGFSERNDGIRTYAPHFDRRHNVNLVGNYKLGKNESWAVSARWNYGSGFPLTKTAGYYELLPFTAGLNTDITTENGIMEVLYGPLNDGRQPDYHRLDIALAKTITFSRNSNLEITVSLTNAYNRENIFYFHRIRNERVDQLPVLPSLGLTLTF